MKQDYIHFNNSYLTLPSEFYTKIKPRVPSKPAIIEINTTLAKKLNLPLSYLNSVKGLNFLSGSKIANGSDPIATVYAGHQFGHFSSQLGDGRAILLGEVIDKRNKRFDIQLKGSGRTPYSRAGDGNAAMGPVLREYIVSEAMHAMGIPTTRSLAAISTGDNVIRDRILPGALLVRVAQSHIRVGTFEFFAARGRFNDVASLANYSIRRHFPKLKNKRDRYLGLLNAATLRQAQLVAKWMSVGFVHGVMNTDNMLISGETIDYGPCAFMDEYNPEQVYSSIDYQGRYKFSNQPKIAQWNLSRLAETLLPIIAKKPEEAVPEAQKIIETFESHYTKHFEELMLKKIGVPFAKSKNDRKIFYHLKKFLNILKNQKSDYTNSFRTLEDHLAGKIISKNLNCPDLTIETKLWVKDWISMLNHMNLDQKTILKNLRESNPRVIPRNHQIEKIIQNSVFNIQNGHFDFTLFKTLEKVCSSPFKQLTNTYDFALPPSISEKVRETFCGT